MENIRGNILIKSFIVFSISLLISVSAVRAQGGKNVDSLKKSLSSVNDTLKIRNMLELMKHYSVEDSGKAFQYGRQALKLSTDLGYKNGVAKSLNDIGKIKNMNGNVKDALEYYKKSLAVRQQMNDYKEIANSLSDIGSVYFKLANYSEAQKYFMQALSIRKKAGNNTEISLSLNNLGSVYLKKGNYKEALDYFEKSLKIRRKTGPQSEIAKILSNIGDIYLKQNNYKEALDVFIQTSRIEEETGDKKELAVTLNNIGLIDLKLGDYSYASIYLFKSLEIRQEIGDNSGMAESLNNIAVNYRHTNNIDKAIKYSERSLALAENSGDEDIAISACENLARSFAEIKNYQKAYAYQTKSSRIADSLFNIRKSKQISNLQTSYESEKSELQIKLQKAELQRQRQFIYFILFGLVITVLLSIFLLKIIRDKHRINLILEKQKDDLTEKQEIINQKNKDLEESNAVKDKFFAIIGHDLRSPIANLQSMLDLLQSGDVTNNEFSGFVEQLNKRVYATRSLIDNLLNWAMTQKDGDNFNPEKINLKEIVDENVELVKKTAEEKGITITNNINKEFFAVADLDMTKLVIRNLITNAIKFTRQNGRVIINSFVENGKIGVSVIDNGIGIEKENLKRLFDVAKSFSTAGTAGEIGSGLGLGLCKEFVEKNGGSIWAESKPGEGSIFKFTLRTS